MAKALKRMMVAEYEQALDGLDGVIVLDTGPMTVEANQAFRRDLREKAGGARLQDHPQPDRSAGPGAGALRAGLERAGGGPPRTFRHRLRR